MSEIIGLLLVITFGTLWLIQWIAAFMTAMTDPRTMTKRDFLLLIFIPFSCVYLAYMRLK